MIVWVCLNLHLLFCLLVLLAWRRHWLNTCLPPLLAAVVLIPPLGALLLVQEEYAERRRQMGKRRIDLDKLKIEDVRFKPIPRDLSEKQQQTVPLEEAIAINDAKTRRRLILDVLNHNPGEYVNLLQVARLADDTELSHYATTTMMEIQSRYEKEIRDLEAEQQAQPDNPSLNRRLRRELQRYIASGLLSGHVRQIYRQKLDRVLTLLWQADPESRRECYDWLDNQLELGWLEPAAAEITAASRRWPADARFYILRVKLAYLAGRGEEIQAALQEIQDKHIYLTTEEKQWYHFWRQQGGSI